MIQGNSNFHNHSHYFDIDGFTHAIKIGSSSEFNPQPIEFFLQDNRIIHLFLMNNPWRALYPNEGFSQMVYQFCVLCKDKRFENESFSGTKDDFETLTNTIRPGESLSICRTCPVEKWFKFSGNFATDKFFSMFSLEYINQLPEIIAQDRSRLEYKKQ